MTLDEYLYDNNLTMAEFAKSIGYASGYVSQCKTGTRKASKRLKFIIEKMTQGKVILNA